MRHGTGVQHNKFVRRWCVLKRSKMLEFVCQSDVMFTINGIFLHRARKFSCLLGYVKFNEATI